MFDLKTRKVLSKAGDRPKSRFDHLRALLLIAYSPSTAAAVTRLPSMQKPEPSLRRRFPSAASRRFAQVDGKGHIYVNIEDKAEIIEVDAKNALVSKGAYSIAPCDDRAGSLSIRKRDCYIPSAITR